MADSERSFVFLTGGGQADPGQQDRLAALEARLAQPGAKLLLHLHGGLVDEEAGIAGAARLAGQTPDSWNRGDDWTQVYIVWRTGMLETVQANWRDLLHDDRLYQVILSKLIRFVARKIGIPAPEGARSVSEQMNLDEAEVYRIMLGKAGDAQRSNPFGEVEPFFEGSVPRSTVMGAQPDGELAHEFVDELVMDADFSKALVDLDNAVNDGLPGRTALAPGDAAAGRAMYHRLSANIRTEIGPVDTLEQRTARGPIAVGAFIVKHVTQIAYRSFKRFRSHRDHGFHATIVEELCRQMYGDLIGAKIWGMMTTDAREHFETGGFGIELLELLGRVPQPDRFVVAGHSAGSIWASHMLLAMKTAGLDRRIRLVLLAPAVRQDIFADVIATAGDLIDGCTMYTMNDDLERRDAVLGHDKSYIYPSSLLYCVSGMFEERAAKPYLDAPLLGMQRFAGVSWLDDREKQDGVRIAAFFRENGNAIILSPAAGVCEAKCHGCFDEEPLTLASAAAIF